MKKQLKLWLLKAFPLLLALLLFAINGSAEDNSTNGDVVDEWTP